MIRLSVMCAIPGEVTIGGVEYPAPKLRVRDIGALETWIARIMATPGDDGDRITCAADVPGMSPDDLWPPELGSVVGLRLLNCNGGLARVLHASLSQRDATLTPEACIQLALSMTSEEVAAFYTAVFPRPTGQARGPDGPPMDWHAGIMHLVELYRFTPDYCLDMAVDLFFAMFRAGEDEPFRLDLVPDFRNDN